jgi:hypothetical protein
MPTSGLKKKKKIHRPSPLETGHSTTEVDSYLSGLFKEFFDQLKRYSELTNELMSLEARIELSEKTVCLTRDHLAMAIENSDSRMPQDWEKTLSLARFVGSRLVDACQVLLREHKRMHPEELRDQLNIGMFRFRTSAPLREIHAGLLRQSFAVKTDGVWVWSGEQEPLPLRIVSGGGGGEAAQS